MWCTEKLLTLKKKKFNNEYIDILLVSIYQKKKKNEEMFNFYTCP